VGISPKFEFAVCVLKSRHEINLPVPPARLLSASLEKSLIPPPSDFFKHNGYKRMVAARRLSNHLSRRFILFSFVVIGFHHRHIVRRRFSLTTILYLLHCLSTMQKQPSQPKTWRSYPARRRRACRQRSYRTSPALVRQPTQFSGSSALGGPLSSAPSESEPPRRAMTTQTTQPLGIQKCAPVDFSSRR
jgi:hypothetical protein